MRDTYTMRNLSERFRPPVAFPDLTTKEEYIKHERHLYSKYPYKFKDLDDWSWVQKVFKNAVHQEMYETLWKDFCKNCRTIDTIKMEEYVKKVNIFLQSKIIKESIYSEVPLSLPLTNYGSILYSRNTNIPSKKARKKHYRGRDGLQKV